LAAVLSRERTKPDIATKNLTKYDEYPKNDKKNASYPIGAESKGPFHPEFVWAFERMG
jgi:hypothetical protein